MIAKKYAKLLFENSQDPATMRELQLCADGITADPAVYRFFSTPVDKHSSANLLDKVLKKHKVSALIAKFLNIMLKNKRIALLPAIISEYNLLLETKDGQKIVDVSSSKEMLKADKAKIEKILIDKFGKNILVKYHIEESVISGIVARSGSLLLDASLQNALSKIV